MVEEIKLLKESMLSKQPVLFLGAGFSRESICENGVMPTGEDLRKELIEKFLIDKVSTKDLEEIYSMNLRDVCDQVVFSTSKHAFYAYLTNRFVNVKPNASGYHNKIINYPWSRIYTVNIDDLLENIFTNKRVKYRIFDGKRKTEDDVITLYKLHGSVTEPEKGYIFTQNEYTELITQSLDSRLNEFTLDIFSNDVIFVGASLDEPDLEYYLQKYEDAGYKTYNNRIYFIEPFPKLKMRRKAQQLNAIVIEQTTEQFLELITELSFSPVALEKLKLRLNYNYLFRLSDNKKMFEKVYESNIYEGYCCKWQDVYDNWVFNNKNYISAKEQLNSYIQRNQDVSCFSIYGEAFTGKGTLLKQLGHLLDQQGFEVIEFRGRKFDRKFFLEYVDKCSFEKIALLIDNASFYYSEIERIFINYKGSKKIFIISASRIYYHLKKRYYLEGNPYHEFHCSDTISRNDADVITNMLIMKGYYKICSDTELYAKKNEILQKRSLCNLIIDLTYGPGLKQRVLENILKIDNMSEAEQKLLIEVAVFDNANIETYPHELVILRYGKLVNLDKKTDKANFKISDYIKSDNQGLSLRNKLFHKEILKGFKKKIVPAIIDILIFISRNIVENNNDVWEEIFQSLSQCHGLKELFHMEDKDIGEVLYSIKDYYKDNSYYWLQLGLYEQSLGEYSKAINHLHVSASIRPNSFKIQHAIARNYMRYANSLSLLSIALPIFKKGEELIKKLIESDEHYKKKAKPFSVHCLIEEKVKFVRFFNYEISNDELIYLCNLANEVENDGYMEHARKMLFYLLEEKNKLSLLSININSPFLKIYKENLEDKKKPITKSSCDIVDSIVDSL